ncbi:hypothetical protein Q4R74_14950, partial [Morganella morganii]
RWDVDSVGCNGMLRCKVGIFRLDEFTSSAEYTVFSDFPVDGSGHTVKAKNLNGLSLRLLSPIRHG